MTPIEYLLKLRMRLTIIILTSMLFSLLGAGAYAEDDASNDSAIEIQKINLLSQEIKLKNGAKQSYQFLKQYSEQFSDQAEYCYLLGVAALESGFHKEAVLALEKAVLIQPSYAGAWLDLALAYYHLGELETANSIIQHIEDNFSPPQSLVAELNKAKRLIRQNSLALQWKTELSVLYGYIRNANYGINTSTLQLTLIDGDLVTAKLSPEFRPRSDQAYETRFASSRRFYHSNGAFSDFQVAARVREYASVGEQSFIDAAASWSYLQPLPVFASSYGLLASSYRHFLLDGKNLGSFTTLSAGVKKYFGNCGANIRHEHEMRNFYADGLYDATVPWLAFGAECFWDKWGGQVDYRYGWDRPDGPRIGGSTKREELSAILRWDIQANLFARAIIYFADYQDQKGYSPLIRSDEERNIQRIGQRLELSWKLPDQFGQGWFALLELDNVDTKSNIPLSRYDDTQVFMGIRYQLY